MHSKARASTVLWGANRMRRYSSVSLG
jgi:hypothetical protein